MHGRKNIKLKNPLGGKSNLSFFSFNNYEEFSRSSWAGIARIMVFGSLHSVGCLFRRFGKTGLFCKP